MEYQSAFGVTHIYKSYHPEYFEEIKSKDKKIATRKITDKGINYVGRKQGTQAAIGGGLVGGALGVIATEGSRSTPKTKAGVAAAGAGIGALGLGALGRASGRSAAKRYNSAADSGMKRYDSFSPKEKKVARDILDRQKVARTMVG